MLQGGVWEGRRLLSEAWIDACRTPCPLNPAYGYLWWLNTDGATAPAASPESFFFKGVGANIVWVDPARDLAAVVRWIEASAFPGFVERVVAAGRGAGPRAARPPPSGLAQAAGALGEGVGMGFHQLGGLSVPAELPRRDLAAPGAHAGPTRGIVGESGSGKSTLGRALLRLLPSKGRIMFEGTEISALDRYAMRPHRRQLQMVFQDPYGSLSPRLTVGEIITEGLLVHAPETSAAERDAAAVRALREVDLDPAVRNRFPHEFSGGQRQRIAIARALVLTPDIIVLDEPTSALDRSVQKQVIALLRELQARHGMSYLFISHDLSVVQAISDSVMVMKDGSVVEAGPTAEVFSAPRTDYTRRLMRAAFDLSAVLAERAA